MATTFSSDSLTSPTNAIDSLTRELEQTFETRLPERSESTESSKSASLHSRKSLDIKQATKGQFVVKPQDNDIHRIECTSKEELEVKNDLMPNEAQKTPSGVRFSASRNSVGHYSLGSHR